MSPFSCRLWSEGRLTMKRLSLLLTRCFSEALGLWGTPGGTADTVTVTAAPGPVLSTWPPSPTWSPGALSGPWCLILVPTELRRVPKVSPVQPTRGCVHGVLHVLGAAGGAQEGLGVLGGWGQPRGCSPACAPLTSRRMTRATARAHSWMVASWSDCSRNSFPVTVRSWRGGSRMGRGHGLPGTPTGARGTQALQGCPACPSLKEGSCGCA